MRQNYLSTTAVSGEIVMPQSARSRLTKGKAAYKGKDVFGANENDINELNRRPPDSSASIERKLMKYE